MSQSNKSVSPLRQRMIDDMTLRKLSDKTQIQYIRAVKRFAQYFGQAPDLASPEDFRLFQMHLVEQKCLLFYVCFGGRLHPGEGVKIYPALQ